MKDHVRELAGSHMHAGEIAQTGAQWHERSRKHRLGCSGANENRN